MHVDPHRIDPAHLAARGKVRRGQRRHASFACPATVADSLCFLLVFVLAQLSLQAVFGLTFGIQLTHVIWRSQS